MKRTCSVMLALVLVLGLFPSAAVNAEAPAEGAPDIGCYEYTGGTHGRRTPEPMDETFDPSLYGENNVSFIYVSVDGSDETGNGTEDHPYATVGKAASEASSGTTIKVGAGTFVFTESADIPLGVSLEGEGDDTVFTSVTLTAANIGGNAAIIRLHSEEDPKENGNQHVSFISFDGQNTATWAIDISNRNNVSVHDCRITNFRETGVGWHASDLSRQSIEDTNPDVSFIDGTFVTGGRFYNNYLKDNTCFDGWGRGSLFICGLEDFHVYGNVMIEDVRTSPVGSRGVPLKAWYYSGWLRDIKIHDNEIMRLGSAFYSSDGSGWDFAIEIAAPYSGIEIANNHFIGSVDMNGGFTSMGDRTYDYSAWLHDNTFTADPEPKYDGDTPFYNEEYAITLERLTQKTLIEYNTVTGYDTVVYFNGRQEISDVTFRYNLCTELGGKGGSMFRLDGRTSSGFEGSVTVRDLAIYNNVFSSTDGNGASGFGIILGQEMSCPWSLENAEISNNVVDGCVYPYWFAVAKSPTSVSGLNVENNIIHGENGVNMPSEGVSGYVYSDNIVLNDEEWAAAFDSDWYPMADSPAIDAGKPVVEGLTDLSGLELPEMHGPSWTYADGILTVSGVGDMDPYTSVNHTGRPWQQYADSIDRVVIENGVTVLYNYLFYGLGSLTSAVIPESVTRIYVQTFGECPLLSDVYYEGTASQWKEITKYTNTEFGNVTVHCDYVSAPKIYGRSITLEDDIRMRFSVKITTGSDISDYYAVFTREASDGTVTETVGGSQAVLKDGRYYFEAGVPVKNIGDRITFCLYETGSEGPVQTVEYSVAQYCADLLDTDAEQKYKDLAGALMNYGYAAQRFFGYDGALTEDLALDLSDVSIPEEADRLVRYPDVTEMRYVGTSLVFKDRIMIRVYFRPADPEDSVDAHTFTDSRGEQLTPVQGDYGYCADIKDIGPKDLDEQYTLYVDGRAFVSYSPLTYAYRMSVNSNDAALKDLCRALYYYWLMASRI